MADQLLVPSLEWRHNERDGVSNHRRLDCLFKRLFRSRSKKISKLRVTGLCEGNSLVAGEFPHKGQVTREMFPFHDAIMWWHHRALMTLFTIALDSQLHGVQSCSCDKIDQAVQWGNASYSRENSAGIGLEFPLCIATKIVNKFWLWVTLKSSFENNYAFTVHATCLLHFDIFFKKCYSSADEFKTGKCRFHYSLFKKIFLIASFYFSGTEHIIYHLCT